MSSGKGTTQQFNLIPGLNFSVKPEKIMESNDQNFLWSSGIYPPSIKCYDLKNMGLKVERRVKSMIKDLKILSNDWKKLILLRHDNYMEFHTKAGCHYQLKISGNGVNINYHPLTSNVYIPTNPDGLVKICLEKGKVNSKTLDSEISEITTSEFSSNENLLALGTSEGMVKIMDVRSKEISFGNLLENRSSRKWELGAISCLNFDSKYSTILHAGTSNGSFCSFDLRNLNFQEFKLNRSNNSVQKIASFSDNSYCIAACGPKIYSWKKNVPEIISIINENSTISDFCKLKNSGMVLVCNSEKFVRYRFLKKLGPLPNWLNYKKIYLANSLNPGKTPGLKFLNEISLDKYEKVTFAKPKMT